MDENDKFDPIDIKNAVRLLHDYCVSKGTCCKNCVVNKHGGTCPLAIVPCVWEVEEK